MVPIAIKYNTLSANLSKSGQNNKQRKYSTPT